MHGCLIAICAALFPIRPLSIVTAVWYDLNVIAPRVIHWRPSEGGHWRQPHAPNIDQHFVQTLGSRFDLGFIDLAGDRAACCLCLAGAIVLGNAGLLRLIWSAPAALTTTGLRLSAR